MGKMMGMLSLVAIAAVAVVSPATQASPGLQVTVDVNSVWIQAGKAPVLQYRYGDVPFKPYIKELYTPSGLNVLLDAPPDHLHHHGLMFAVAVNDLNFWEETPTAGRQNSFLGVSNTWSGAGEGPMMAGFHMNLSWLDAAGKEAELAESRIIEVSQPAKPGPEATVVLWHSILTVPRNKKSVTLSGSHYFGLGMRFVRAMDGGEFFNADGKEGTVFRGEERLVQSDWCAYTAAIEGKPVTVAMLGYPGNPRHPTTWFTMAKPFAYLSGTLNLHKEPLSLTAEKLLSLQYAVVVWDGKVDKDQINRAYQWFVGDYWKIHKPVEGAKQDEKQK